MNSTQLRDLPDPRIDIRGGKSPGLSRTALSPLPASSRKLTTKNLPILI